MITRLFAGAAAAALMGSSVPALAATSPDLPGASIQVSPSALQAVNAFYAARGNAPLWLRAGADSGAARALIDALQRSSLDGLDEGPAIATQARSLLTRAQAGDVAALRAADRLLSVGWVRYVQTLQQPPSGMIYADNWVRPRQESAGQILAKAAATPSLASHVRSVSQVNPLYAQLRDAAWSAMQANGGGIDPRVLISLDRAREIPPQQKYVMVDTAAARLYMIEDGRVAGSMKVAVGKPGEKTQTPMLASTIYYATLNPYWHVGPDLIRSLIAKNVLEQGVSYLQQHGYQVMPADKRDDRLLDPSQVDWRAVAAGTQAIRVRQLPGPGNSMGRVKFGFPNSEDIYLHDTPMKDLFAQDDRTISHGCVRLEDSERLTAWMMGRTPQAATTPEQNVPLPTPVPIYVTYLTAQAQNGQLSFLEDIYGRDEQAMRMAALR